MENNSLNLKSPSGKALLFDMDGTLTPARKKVDLRIYDLIERMISSGHLVCVVSGSPMNYIIEQLCIGDLEYNSSLVLMPCNGTLVYQRSKGDSKYKQTYKVTLRNHLDQSGSTPEPYRELVTNILELQLYAMRKYKFSVTGNFISDRSSMINWSMIGRDASHEVRDAFAIEDSKLGIRKHLRECLRVRLDAASLHGIDLTLGGSTSIDIFPVGWDKTHALRHLDSSMQPWFWGDKCMPGGNDHALWEALNPVQRSFSVESPEDTLQSIHALIEQEWL